MRLNDYLAALQKSPDEQLEDEFGIDDNWPIFLNADFNSVINHLKNSGKYIFTEKMTNNSGDEILLKKGNRYDKNNISFIDKKVIRWFFYYVPGTVKLQALNIVPLNYCSGSDEDIFRQKRDYNMMIMLHPYQENKIEGTSDSRALAIVIKDIGDFVIKEKIPASMPFSMSYKNRQDYSRIVYHQP